MKQKSGPDKAPAEQVLKDIRRQTRRQYSAEEKIRIVLEGLRGEENISELCRREGIAASMYYGWSKEFLEAGKRRLAGDTARAATSGLAALVQQMFGLDPFSGAAFVFRAKRADRVKILVWDRTGMVLVHKRLEGCKFVWPQVRRPRR